MELKIGNIALSTSKEENATFSKAVFPEHAWNGAQVCNGCCGSVYQNFHNIKLAYTGIYLFVTNTSESGLIEDHFGYVEDVVKCGDEYLHLLLKVI